MNSFDHNAAARRGGGRVELPCWCSNQICHVHSYNNNSSVLHVRPSVRLLLPLPIPLHCTALHDTTRQWYTIQRVHCDFDFRLKLGAISCPYFLSLQQQQQQQQTVVREGEEGGRETNYPRRLHRQANTTSEGRRRRRRHERHVLLQHPHARVAPSTCKFSRAPL